MDLRPGACAEWRRCAGSGSIFRLPQWGSLLATLRLNPDSGFSIYAQDGVLWIESARWVPTELKSVSTNVFGFLHGDLHLAFALDASGHAASFTFSNDPDTAYVRTGGPVHHVFHEYVRTEAMIPMRDGVKLHAVILKPTDITTPLPILMERTPYGVDDMSRIWFFAQRPELARAGYIYVGEDIRGRYKSEGRICS